MIAERAPHTPHVTVAEEDPRSADAIGLSDIMADITFRLYPEDAENGIFPTTTEELAQHGVLVIARIDGEAAACGALMVHAAVDGLDVLEVKRMLVLPAFRGRGLSRLVLNRLEKVARQRQMQKLVLMCGPRQPEALRLYESHGFVRRSAYGKHTEHPLSFFYEKTL
jgi:GNAT superfamily N-acetyltransferase